MKLMIQHPNQMFLNDDKRLIAAIFEDEKRQLEVLKCIICPQGNLKELLPPPNLPIKEKQ